MRIPIYGKTGIVAYAQVSVKDYRRVNRYRWFNDGRGYVQGKVNGTLIKMHRFILDAPKGKYVDHKNHDTLDNRRKNIRICSQSENIANSKLSKNNTSGHEGVYWEKRRKKWYAQVMYQRKHVHLGSFDTLEEAILAHQEGKAQLFKGFINGNPSQN